MTAITDGNLEKAWNRAIKGLLAMFRVQLPTEQRTHTRNAISKSKRIEEEKEMQSASPMRREGKSTQDQLKT